MKYRREWKLDNPTHVTTCAVAMLFLGAGVIHLSAAADHRSLPVMMAGFTIVALAQMGVAALLFLRGPSLRLVAGGLVLMLGSVAVWLLSRTIGLPFLPGGHMEPIGFKDGVTVLFELAAVPGLMALTSPWLRQMSLPSPHLGRQALTGLAAAIALMFVPALLLGGGGHHSADQLAAISGGHAHGSDDPEGTHEGHEDGHETDGHEGGGHEEGHAPGAADGDGQTLLSQGHHGQGVGPDTHEGHGMAGSDNGADGHEGHGSHGGSGSGHEGQGSHSGAMPASDHGGHGRAGGHDEGGHDEGGHGEGGHNEGGHNEGGHGEGGHDEGGHDEGGHGDTGGHDDGGHGDEEGHGGHGDGGEADRGSPPVPGVATRRAQYIEPKPSGTKETITLQYGPHPVTPGGDANQVNFDFFGATGFIVAAKPSIRYADGTAVDHTSVHLHHAHLLRKDTEEDDAADTRQGIDWVFGTGGEQTQGSFERISAAQPGGDQWGIPLKPEELVMYWMPMNMTDQTQAVFMEFEFTFVHGTSAEIKKATGTTYRPVEPVIYGSTFDVPRTGDIYDWPLDAKPSRGDALSKSKADPNSFGTAEPREKSNVEVGVGEIWTAPRDGVLIGGAGHQHGGAKGVVLSNLGSRAQPCAEDGDRFPGTTVFNSKTYYPDGVWPAHPLMGISQPGWRVPVKKGDRIAMNGVFDARKYAFPDQMSITGFYWDKSVRVSNDQRCRAWLADEPDATPTEAADSLPHQTAERGDDGGAWVHATPQSCVAEECNDPHAPKAPRGPHTNVITAENFMFTPGDLNRRSTAGNAMGSSSGGAPVVERGEKLRFVNLDFVEKGGTRHVITSCIGPCNGPTDVMSYPNTNGKFYSGPLGYLPLADGASANNKAAPTWELDTAKLKPGYHTYYCWNHPWMRGAFYVEEMSETGQEKFADKASRGVPQPEVTSIPEMLREASRPDSPPVSSPLDDVARREETLSLPGS
jgi:hypothetical protein